MMHSVKGKLSWCSMAPEAVVFFLYQLTQEYQAAELPHFSCLANPDWNKLFVLVLQHQIYGCCLEIDVALEKGAWQRAVAEFGIFPC